MISFSVKVTDPQKLETDVCIGFVFENESFELPQFNQAVTAIIRSTADRESFNGKRGEHCVIYTRGLISPYKLILIGLGKKDSFDTFRLYSGIAESAKIASGHKPVKISYVFPPYFLQKFTAAALFKTAVEAISLSQYIFLKYRMDTSKEFIRRLDEVLFFVRPNELDVALTAVRSGEVFSRATAYARDLVNEPAQFTTPAYLASVAVHIGKQSKGKVKVKVLEEQEVKELGMNAFLGVARGSHEPPKFIRLEYKPNQQPKKKIVLIGKGITFDSGGLSLKGSEHMETMKTDMSGAATVLAVFREIANIRTDYHVVGLIAACENMPSGNALRPGDILTSMGGKTIEVLNTDAEGRLTLADVLSFAVMKEKPNYIIDLATLTGACKVALGDDIAGLWCNNDSFAGDFIQSSCTAGEKMWRMPLEDEYRVLLKSDIADLKNVQSGRYGGAITAALFLEEFVREVPWIHLDIAGPAFIEKNTPVSPKGGAGFGVRTLLHFLSA